MLLIAVSPAATTADAPKLTDELTAWGTVGLAAVTVVALIVTIVLARRDRNDARERLEAEQRRAEADRADSDRRLREEREAADQRLRDERALADLRQVRERQIANASALIQRISTLVPHIEVAAHPPMIDPRQKTSAQAECDLAIRSLQEGARTEALALSNPAATKLYMTLTHLVVSARSGKWVEQLTERAGGHLVPEQRTAARDRVARDLRNFARYVRLWIAALIDGAEIPEDVLGPFESAGSPLVPILGAESHSPGWAPQSFPPRWNEDQQVDPDDPQFRPAR